MVGRAKYQLTKRKIILAEVDAVALMQSAASLATGQAKAMSKAAQATSSCACEVIGERGYDLQWSQRWHCGDKLILLNELFLYDRGHFHFMLQSTEKKQKKTNVTCSCPIPFCSCSFQRDYATISAKWSKKLSFTLLSLVGNSLTYFNLLGAVGSFRKTTRNNSLFWGQVFSNDLLTIIITLKVITDWYKPYVRGHTELWLCNFALFYGTF